MKSRSGCQLTEKRYEFRWRLSFFLEITRFWTEKRSEFASIQLKPNENSGQVRLRLNQTSPPLRNPGYTTVSSHSNNYSYVQFHAHIFNSSCSVFFRSSIVYYLSRTEVESRTQRSKHRPMIQKNPRSRPRADFSRPRTGMLKAKDTRRIRCSPKRNKRSSREEMPISKVKWKKLMAMDHFQQFNVIGREQGIFEDLQASRPRIWPSKPKPRTSKCVIEDSASVIWDS